MAGTSKYTVISQQMNRWDDDAKGPATPLYRGQDVDLSDAEAERLKGAVLPHGHELARKARIIGGFEQPADPATAGPYLPQVGTAGIETLTDDQLKAELERRGTLATLKPAPTPEDGKSREQAAAGSGKPAGNASHDKWIAYAISQGMTADEAKGTSRDELAAKFADA